MQLIFTAIVFCVLFSSFLAENNVIKNGAKTAKNEPKHPKIIAFNKNAHLRPTKCQVCRVLVTELMIELNKTAGVRDTFHLSSMLDDDDVTSNSKKIDYHRSEIRLMDSMEKVCMNTQNYKAIAGPDFPYLKGVKSMFQTELENMMGKSGLKMKLDAPQDIVDDPTLEVKRLKAFCDQMIENHEEDIEDWYMNHSGQDPLDYVCSNKVLQGNDTDCLRASTEVPDFATKPLPADAPSIARGEL